MNSEFYAQVAFFPVAGGRRRAFRIFFCRFRGKMDFFPGISVRARYMRSRSKSGSERSNTARKKSGGWTSRLENSVDSKEKLFPKNKWKYLTLNNLLTELRVYLHFINFKRGRKITLMNLPRGRKFGNLNANNVRGGTKNIRLPPYLIPGSAMPRS